MALTERQNSYGQILKSSSIVGGAQAITLIIGMIRTKLVAVLLGPSGVGLVAFFHSATGLVGTVSGLGIAQSSVRQVAEAAGNGDPERIALTVLVLRRVCWLTGLLGWLLIAALSWPLSMWAFTTGERAWALALLGGSLFLAAISGGQTALLQGLRRIGDIAKLQIASALLGALVSVGLYAWLGERGIVPAILISAAVALLSSWWLSRKVPISSVELTWRQTATEARRFVSLGLAFMWAGLLTAGVGLATQSMISRKFGLDANGIYQAAWGLSGVFAGFILTAMGTDFYPRLTAVANINQEVNRQVNEQTEVGVLLALPGLLATLVFSPWVIRLFLTAKFLPAADLLPWFVLGICGRVICWPIGYILLAKGASRAFALTETLFNLCHVLLIWLGLQLFGLVGAAAAFVIMYASYTVAMLWVAGRLTGFRWSSSVSRLLVTAVALVALAYATVTLLSPLAAAFIGTALVVSGTIYSIRQLTARLGSAHRISRLVSRLPMVGPYLAALP